MTFEWIRDLVLSEDVRRKNQGRSSSSEMFYVGRGRRNSRDSGSRGSSSSRIQKSVKCWNCNEVGHVKSQCPKKQLNAATEDVFEDDALILSDESSVDSWVMDSGASIHATHISELMKNLQIGDFGKVRLGNGEFLNVTGIEDIDLETPLGTTWKLHNVRVILGLKTKLISVSQMDEFGSGKWKVIKGNLGIAWGKKQRSLYLVEAPAKERSDRPS